jgi:hypothetical protein
MSLDGAVMRFVVSACQPKNFDRDELAVMGCDAVLSGNVC